MLPRLQHLEAGPLFEWVPFCSLAYVSMGTLDPLSRAKKSRAKNLIFLQGGGIGPKQRR
jgi:hypothetical protein